MRRTLKLVFFILLLSGIPSRGAENDFFREKCVPVILDYIGENKNAAKWAEEINPDGSWSDVKYFDDDETTGWDPGSHCNRFSKMAALYCRTGDAAVLESCRKALSYWYKVSTESRDKLGYDTQWYYRMLYVPRALGPGLLLLRDELSSEEISKAAAIMSEAEIYESATGFNRLHLAGNILMRGALLRDSAVIEYGRDVISSVIEITTAEEGLQPDMTFHQHGAMLQQGTYGLGFVKGLCWWYKVLKDTPYALPADKSEILLSFMRDGMRWFDYKGYFDMSGLGRQIQLGTQISRSRETKEICSLLGIEDPEPTGARYFPYSDYGIYRNDRFYASLRMQSNRVKGFEYINNMNKKGWFSSDGALLVRRTGDEYDDIPPCWDWTKIPGATTWDDGSDLTLRRKNQVRPVDVRLNITDKVFGKAEGSEMMAAAMELNRDGLKARKAWFFYPDGIVCLGNGISYVGNGTVVTTINQCVAKDDYLSGKNWFFQDGITYIMLAGTKAKAVQEQRQGRWTDIHEKAPSRLVKKNIFELYVDHGEKPSNASYAYVICPVGLAPSKVAKSVATGVQILENSENKQAVKIGGRVISIDWITQNIIIE